MSSLPARSDVNSLPGEVFVNIIEHCDIQTLARLRLVDKATKALISTFEKQIAATIAARLQPHFKHLISNQSVIPSGLQLLRRIQRLPVVKALCAEFQTVCDRYSAYRPRMPPSSAEAKQQFFHRIENGCAVAWKLADIYSSAKRKLENDPAVRPNILETRLYREVTSAQLALVALLPALDITDYRLLYMLRATASFGWLGSGIQLSAPYRAKGVPLCSSDLLNRFYADTHGWAYWFSLNKTNPDRMLPHFRKAADHHADGNYDSRDTEDAIAAVSKVYWETPESTRRLQIESAKKVLTTIDRKVSCGGVRPSQVMREAFGELSLDHILGYRSYWTRSMLEIGCMVAT